MKITPAEAKERTAYFRRAQTELVAGLKQPSVQRELGQKALQLLNIVEQLYVPKVIDGVITIPRRYRNPSGATPLIVVKPSEEFRLDESAAVMNEYQRERYVQILSESLGDDIRADCLDLEAEAIKQRLKKTAPDRPIRLGGSRRGPYLGSVTSAFTKTDEYKLRTDPERKSLLARGRPLVMLAFRPEDVNSEILLHEANHVTHFEDRPVWPIGELEYATEFWRQEYDCYNLEARYAEALDPSSDEIPSHASWAKKVASTMASLSGNNPTPSPDQITPEMMKYIEEIGYPVLTANRE